MDLTNKVTLVGVSGAQGAGKTTLLQHLTGLGFKVDDFKVSRAVQEQLGWSSLGEVMRSPQTMVDFQEEVLRQKFKRDFHLKLNGIDREGLWLTERTFADISAYATFWTWELVDARKWTFREGSEWLSDFVSRCTQAQINCYDGIVLLPLMSHIKWQEDVSRASRQSVDTVWGSIDTFVASPQFANMPKCRLVEKTVEERAHRVARFLEQL